MKDLFSNDRVNIPLLRERAYNLRWAVVPSDVIPLTAADPDFPVAKEIQEAICNYVEEGYFPYVPPEGLPEFRSAAARFYTEKKKVSCSSDQILAIDGAASGMFVITRFALKPGDEALVFNPVDFLFRQSVLAAGGKVIEVPLNIASGAFDPKLVRSLITPRTRLLGICNPHNPLGHVLTEKELRFLGELAVEFKLWILNDEIWSDIVYPPHHFLSIASLSPEIAKRVITVYGFSKAYGLAGMRVGFLVSPNLEVQESLVQSSRVRTTAAGVFSLSQIAATAALEKCAYWVEAFLKHLAQLRDEGVKRLNQIPKVKCHTPEGTYLLFPDVREFGMSSQKLSEYILEKGKVAVVPGAPEWFGSNAEGHLRICFSTSRKIFNEGLDRIEAALRGLK